jgi:hypothetical protein
MFKIINEDKMNFVGIEYEYQTTRLIDLNTFVDETTADFIINTPDIEFPVSPNKLQYNNPVIRMEKSDDDEDIENEDTDDEFEDDYDEEDFEDDDEFDDDEDFDEDFEDEDDDFEEEFIEEDFDNFDEDEEDFDEDEVI